MAFIEMTDVIIIFFFHFFHVFLSLSALCFSFSLASVVLFLFLPIWLNEIIFQTKKININLEGDHNDHNTMT